MTDQNKTPAESSASALSVVAGSAPVAWMRRWHYEGEKEYKVLNKETGRMGLHNKFKWLPVTLTKLMDDDVPLYVLPNIRSQPHAEDKGYNQPKVPSPRVGSDALFDGPASDSK